MEVIISHLQLKVQASVVERQKKKFYHPSLSFGKEDTLMILLSAWDRSRDSTAKINIVKGHVEDLYTYHNFSS